MSYRVTIARSAQKEMARLHPNARAAVDRKILALADNPRPPGAKPLKGEWKGCWRVRAGDHRVVYEFSTRERTVRVAAVGPRESIYD